MKIMQLIFPQIEEGKGRKEGRKGKEEEEERRGREEQHRSPDIKIDFRPKATQ